MAIRILLADDHRILREGLKKLIEEEEGFLVVGEAKDGLETVRLAQNFTPEMVIMDISMPGLNGIEATIRILSEYPETKVIALSMHRESKYVMGMLEAGAKGYLLKDCAFDEVIKAISTVAGGSNYLSPGITDIVITESLNRMGKQVQTSARSLLTQREIEVLQLLAEGIKSKEVGKQLFISKKTVETHRRNIMQKLNLNSTAELVRFAIREGITSVEK
ncbi:response regulator transcription factor [Desulfococcaceae bacterium HSG8]|nr:response regulator transcription factor [Desulfococcaceae bacterium HSG8]